MSKGPHKLLEGTPYEATTEERHILTPRSSLDYGFIQLEKKRTPELPEQDGIVKKEDYNVLIIDGCYNV